MNEETKLDGIGQLVTDSLNTEPSSELEIRLRRRLDAFKVQWDSEGVVSPVSHASVPRRKWLHWTITVKVMTALTLTILMFAIFLSPFGSSDSLAQIAQVIAKKQWLRASGVGINGEATDLWFSASHGVLASRTNESFLFIDQRLGKIDVCGKPFSTESIQRTSLNRTDNSGIRASHDSLLALLTGDLQSAMKAGDRQVIEHHEKSVDVDGQPLIEHRYIVSNKQNEKLRTETVLHVDPTSGLPMTWRIESGGQVLGDYKVSYPDHGPLSIVGLGAPADVPVVDQTPRGQFKDVLLATDTARKRFDDYHAIVMELSSSDRTTNGAYFHIWRKGTRWRIDHRYGHPGGGMFLVHERPTAGVDPETWWLQKASERKSYPYEIWDGKRLWNFNPNWSRSTPPKMDPNGNEITTIESLSVMSGTPLDPRDPQMNFGAMIKLPERWAYESLHLGEQLGFRAETSQASLNDVPMTRVEIWEAFFGSSKKLRNRYWLDPSRDHLIVRKEWADAKIGNVTEIFATARTPQGLWYPTILRQINGAVSMETGERFDHFTHYFLEFNVEMPDELFSGEAVNLTNPWTEFK